MDSEHRHELEENWLAKKLATAIEDAKPRLPAYGLALALLVIAVVALKGFRSSAETARAERWSGFSQALETGQPDPILLREVADKHAGTSTGEWAEVTWADSRLFQAAGGFFRNRTEADKAVAEAVEAYEQLIGAKDRDVAERAGFQLARAYELQGKLEDSIKQYGRVTGPFQTVAENRAEELGEERVRASYAWISATKTAPSSGETAPAGDATPDDLDLPEEDADETLGALLDEATAEEEQLPSEIESGEETVEEAKEEAAEETADASTESAE